MTTYLRKRQVRARYGEVSDRSVDRMVQDGRLPKPRYFGGNRIPFWSETELDDNDRAAVVRPRPQGPYTRLLMELPLLPLRAKRKRSCIWQKQPDK